MRTRFTAFAFCLLFAPLTTAQGAPNAITNSDVISMTKAGIGEQTIILAIQRGPDKFDTSPQALIALKRAGVPDQVLNAILSAPKEGNSGPERRQFQPSPQTPEQPGPEENVQQSTPAGEMRNACTPQPGETFAASTARTTCCEKGFGSACSNLARFYATGTEGVPTDLFIANDLKKRACAMGQAEDCYVNISDESELQAFEKAVGMTDPIAKEASLETFLQAYPQSAAKPAVLEMLAEIKRQAEASANASPPQVPNTTQPQPSGSTASQSPPESMPQGFTIRVLQEQSIPYTRESGGGTSTTCNIVGTANTSAYVNAYGNSAYGNATTDLNQRMECNSYDTTIRWPHVLNVMFAQASDGISYIIACDKAWRWSKCGPLRAGDTFSARITAKGIEVKGVNSKGKGESLTYQILQSKAWR